MSTLFNSLTLPRIRYETQPGAASYQGNDVCIFPPTDSTQKQAGNFYAGNRILGDGIQDANFSRFGDAAWSLVGGFEAAKSGRIGGNLQVDNNVTILGGTGLTVVNGSITATQSNIASGQFQTIIASGNVSGSSISAAGPLNGGSLNVTGSAQLTNGVTISGANTVLQSNSNLQLLSQDINSISTVGGINAAKGVTTTSSYTVTQTSPVASSVSLSLNSTDGSAILQNNNQNPIYLLTAAAINFQSSLSSNAVNRLSLTDVNVSTPLPIVSTNTSATAFQTTGGISVGGVGSFSSILVTSTTASTSATSGSIVTNGGLGVAGNTFLAGTLSVANILNANQGISATSITVNNTDNATSLTSGSLVVKGGIAVNQDMYINGKITQLSSVDAASLGIGAVVTSGGASVAKTLMVGGNVVTQSSAIVQQNMNIGGTCSVSGAMYANSSLNATSSFSAALVSSGGLAVAKDINAAGGMTLANDARIGGSCQVANQLLVNSTSDSSMIGAGAMVCQGGASIAKTLSVGSNATVQGDMRVSGQLVVGGKGSKINWEYVESNDNIILVNSGYTSAADGGYAASRYQIANDSGNGSVVADAVPFFTGSCGNTNNTATTINLGSTASSVDGIYTGMWILDQNNQARQIKSYVGSTKIATIYGTADQSSDSIILQGKDFSILPTASLTYKLFNRQYMIHAFIESQNRTVFGSTPINPASSALANIQQTESIQVNSLYADGATYSDSLQPRTSINGPMQLGGMTVAGTTLAGVTSINGRTLTQSFTITLPDNATTAISLNTATMSGYYVVTVNPLVANGAFLTAVMALYNSSYINKPDYLLSSSGESVGIKWVVGNPIQLYHATTKVGGTGAMITYNVLLEKKF